MLRLIHKVTTPAIQVEPRLFALLTVVKIIVTAFNVGWVLLNWRPSVKT